MLATTRDGAGPLLGRAYEQDLLTSLLDEVVTRGQALVLRGDPGIGKSRLLRPVRDRAVELAPVQRAALDAAFGLTQEAA